MKMHRRVSFECEGKRYSGELEIVFPDQGVPIIVYHDDVIPTNDFILGNQAFQEAVQRKANEELRQIGIENGWYDSK